MKSRVSLISLEVLPQHFWGNCFKKIRLKHPRACCWQEVRKQLYFYIPFLLFFLVEGQIGRRMSGLVVVPQHWLDDGLRWLKAFQKPKYSILCWSIRNCLLLSRLCARTWRTEGEGDPKRVSAPVQVLVCVWSVYVVLEGRWMLFPHSQEHEWEC